MKKIIIIVFSFVLTGFFSACKEKPTNCEVTKVIGNEQATVFYTEIPILTAGIDSLGFVIEQNEQVVLYPYCGQVPLEYRESGLKVRISGSITDCELEVYAPNAKLLPAYMFELTSIERGEQ